MTIRGVLGPRYSNSASEKADDGCVKPGWNFAVGSPVFGSNSNLGSAERPVQLHAETTLPGSQQWFSRHKVEIGPYRGCASAETPPAVLVETRSRWRMATYLHPGTALGCW